MNKDIAQHVFGVLDSGQEAIQYLEKCIDRLELSYSDLGLFDDIGNLVISVESAIASFHTAPNRVKQIKDNLIYYIEKLKKSVHSEAEEFLFDFRFHFKSLYRILEYEFAYIFEGFIEKADYPRFYPEVGSIDHNKIIAAGRNTSVKVSVVLLAYNNLDYTKTCLESIIRCTTDVEYELILVDNGSTDGTLNYFKGITGAKVIHLPYNLHLVKGFNIGLMAAEGKYSAAVCNDFVFSPNWLSNLMLCIESDPMIGYVSPGATFISNCQQINDVPFRTVDQFIEDAGKFNISNSAKWEERVVLLPNVLCCPTALLERIGYYDTRYFRGEFLDDDISFCIRRAGYKLIYCADTVVHHYGSITTVSDHLTNSLEEGRKTFQHKYGLDAWLDARMTPVYEWIDYRHMEGIKSVLGIEVKCGATLLQIKNKLCSFRRNATKVFAAVFEDKYLEDLRTVVDHAWVIHDFTSIRETFDFIYVEKPLEQFPEDPNVLFSMLIGLLTPGGHLLFTANNKASLAQKTGAHP